LQAIRRTECQARLGRGSLSLWHRNLALVTVFAGTGIENLEASALARASRGGLLARRSPLLRFEPDERLVRLIRAGHDGAFEALFNRYNARLLAFCTSMLKSRQDAEDVLQEVFANAHAAMLGDERAINVRPWLYRIARNRCLNHLRKPVPEGQDSMDIHPHQNGTSTAEQVQHREELRQVLADVRTLPETQRTALLLREVDQLAYEEIAVAMDTTVPSIKSLLVRARIGLAESSKARMLTCGEVQVALAEAAEGIGKASGPARKHVRACDGCREFRNQLRTDRKALAALFPLGPFALIKGGVLAKLFGGGAGGSGVAGAGAGTVGGVSAAGGVTGISGGVGLLGSAIGAKAAAGVATAALLTAGAVEVRNMGTRDAEGPGAKVAPAVVAAPAETAPIAAAKDLPQFTAVPVAKSDEAAAPRATEDSSSPPAAGTREDEGVASQAAEPATKDDKKTGVDGDAVIGGAGQVPTEVGPHEGQIPGSAPTTIVPVSPVPATPEAPATEPVASTPPVNQTPTPVSPPPPVAVPPVPVDPGVVEPLPSTTTPPPA